MSGDLRPVQTIFWLFVACLALNSTTAASEVTPGIVTETTTKTSMEGHVSAATKAMLTKVHGLCFIFAWFFCVSVSIFGARYLRNFLPETTPFGLRLWFHIHRSLNVIALILMAVGLVTIFIAHEWRWLGPKHGGGAKNTSATAIHTLFGVLSVAIAVLQPFNALLRCAPQDPQRRLFTWFHRSLGVVGWLLAATAITIACRKFGHHFVDSDVAVSLVAVFLAFVGASVAVAEAFKYRYSRLDKTRDADVEEPRSLQEQVKRVQWRAHLHSHLFFVFTSVALTVCTVFIMCIKGR